ncbi:MAG: HD-GYP domain-containing protein [Pseudomonadota bacterium]
MRVEQVQVEVDNLIKGMYVCQLDRPWLSTPFPFQGFVIRGERDISALQKYCSFVYVDVLRGVPPNADSIANRPWRPGQRFEDDIERDVPSPARRLGPHEGNFGITAVPIKIRSDFYNAPKGFRKEMKRAQQFHLDLSREVASAVDDVRVGRGLTVRGVKRTARHMVQSIIRHPDAFVWMIKLRDRDSYSYGHSVRMAVLSTVLGRHLGLSEQQLDRLALGSLLCEVGKARLPRRLLEKQGPLTEEEVEKVRAHVTDGVQILDRCVGIGDDIIEVVENHHERFDGSGYPEGKFGDQIPLLARIAGLTDTYDAMTSLRPHTDRVHTAAAATDFLYDHRDVLFQAQLVEEFIQALGIYPTGTLVELSTGEVALIKEQNVDQRIQPVVLMVLNQNKRPLEKLERVDLRDYNHQHEDQPVSIKRGLASGEFGLDPNLIMESWESQRPTWLKKLAFAG